MSKRDRRMALLVAAVLLAAVVCRFVGNAGFASKPIGLLRSVIYIGLFSIWGISLRSRIIQVEVRRYLTAIAALMVFWFAVRTVKFHFVPIYGAETLLRYLWYLYYLPMLFIPLLATFVAMSLGKAEDSRLPKKTALLYIPTAVLFLSVLTNDLHQSVFAFCGDAESWTENYDYGIGYYFVLSWMFFCAALTLILMWRKCRIPRSRKRLWMPMIPVCLLFLYALLYCSGVKWLRLFFGDVTAIICLLTAAALEFCIRCGLIQSNTHYAELFDAASVGALITDGDYRVYLSSKTARQIPETLLRATEEAPVLLDGGVRLCAADIRGGHIFWQENIADLLDVLEQLGDIKEELGEYSVLLEEENKQKQRRCELEEQKRLYDAVRDTVAPEMELLDVLIRQLETASDSETARTLHGRIAVTGAYIKRRSNLALLADASGALPAGELLLCLNESLSNLRLAGTACAVQFDAGESIDGAAAGLLYDFFETAVETAWEDLPALNVVVARTDAGLKMTLMLQSKADVSTLSRRFAGAETERDEEVVYCRLTAPRGGVAI